VGGCVFSAAPKLQASVELSTEEVLRGISTTTGGGDNIGKRPRLPV